MKALNNPHIRNSVKSTNSQLARVIVPIVEGQLRSYMKAHPNHFANAPAQQIIASIAKRICNDLLCDVQIARLTEALVDNAEVSEEASIACLHCAHAAGVVAGNCDTRKPTQYALSGKMQIKVEDGGASRIGELEGDDALFVRVQSWDESGEHKMLAAFEGKPVLITIQTIEGEEPADV